MLILLLNLVFLLVSIKVDSAGIHDADSRDCGVRTQDDIDKDYVPWHAIIYQDTKEAGFIPKCAGTILSSSVILTSMQCFFTGETLEPINFFRATVGQNQDDIKITNGHDFIKKIKEVKYSKYYQNYASDEGVRDAGFAVLCGYLIFNEFIKPVCLDLSTDVIDPDNEGLVAGFDFGKDTRVQPYMQTTTVKLYDTAKCTDYAKTNYGAGNLHYYFDQMLDRNGKICGFFNHTKPCLKDRGSGVTYTKTNEDGVVKHYLRAMLSVWPTLEYCQNIVLMTHLTKYVLECTEQIVLYNKFYPDNLLSYCPITN